MLTLPLPSMTPMPISSILSLVFGKDLEMMFLYYGNMYCFSLFFFRLFEYYGYYHYYLFIVFFDDVIETNDQI